MSAAAALYGRPIITAHARPWGMAEGPLENGHQLDPAAIRKLASKIRGRVITPGAIEYESTRLVFNRAFDLRPALIVRCANASDVAGALDFAQSHSLPLSIRGGGHSRLGYGMCDDGVVIDLSGMNSVEVNADRKIARAEAGALARDMDRATQRFGLASTMGGCPTVGIAGLTLGGGEGWLMSKYGAACDNLLSAQLVTVDGKQIEASQKSNPDLFWAIRGGGGNFAVVTALEYQLHTVNDVLSGILRCSPGRIPEMLQAFAAFVAAAPDEMNSLAMVVPSPQGTQFQMAVFYSGDPDRGNGLLRSLRATLKPQEDQVRIKSYLEAQVAGFLSAPIAHFQTDLFLPELNEAAIAAITTATNDAPPQFGVFLVPFSGAITRVASSDMAFPLRQRGYEVDIVCRWSTPADKENAVRWVRRLRDKLRPFAHGAYVNQLGETSDELVRTAYGPNYARLVEIKKKYDPKNVLRLNQNILPS